MENTESEGDLWDDEIKAEAGGDVTDKPPVRWFAYHTVLVWVIGPIAILLMVIGAYLGIPRYIIDVGIYFPLAIAVFITGIASLWAFYRDAKVIAQTEDWKPWWPLWILASLIIGTFFIVPIYLARRRLDLGPADYSNTWFERIR